MGRYDALSVGNPIEWEQSNFHQDAEQTVHKGISAHVYPYMGKTGGDWVAYVTPTSSRSNHADPKPFSHDFHGSKEGAKKIAEANIHKADGSLGHVNYG